MTSSCMAMVEIMAKEKETKIHTTIQFGNRFISIVTVAMGGPGIAEYSAMLLAAMPKARMQAPNIRFMGIIQKMDLRITFTFLVEEMICKLVGPIVL